MQTNLETGLRQIHDPTDYMPRYWFVSGDEASVVQVQRDAFYYNWRRRSSSYPHFSTGAKPNFDRYYETFESFIEEELDTNKPSISTCELAYVDVVESCKYWRGPQDTANVIPLLKDSVEGVGDNPLSSINSVSQYRLSSSSQLEVSIRTAESRDESKLQKLILQFRARGHFEAVDKSDTDGWFVEAHHTILQWFLDITSKEIQCKHWEIEELSD